MLFYPLVYCTLWKVSSRSMNRTELIQAFDAIYREHGGKVFRYILRMVRNHATAEDLLHDAFLNLLAHIEKNDIDIRNVSGFLYRIAYNLCINHIRRGKIIACDALDDIPALPAQESSTTHQQLELEELESRVRDFIATLDAEDRSLFVMSRELQMPFEEIAEAMRISTRTVYRRMDRILAQLLSDLAAGGFVEK
jgi:RNA polymerase sigma factor (sigma-70 family)